MNGDDTPLVSVVVLMFFVFGFLLGSALLTIGLAWGREQVASGQYECRQDINETWQCGLAEEK